MATPSAPHQPSDGTTLELPTDSTEYTFQGKIGQGAFASVWKAQTSTGHEVAVKVLNLDHVDSDLQEIRMEVQLMRLSLHPNLLPCHTAFLASTQLWVVTPFMNKGSAVHCLEEARHTLLSQSEKPMSLEPHLMYILQQTLLGLQYIHDNGHIHRDIKGSNILLNGQGEIKIADFGVSGWLIPQNEKAKTFVGTPCWMAPEVMEQIHGYDYKADLWSLGITALELAKGYAPYAKYPPMKVLILTIQEDPPSLATYDYDESDDDDFYYPQEWSTPFQQVISWLLQKNPADRPTSQALLASPLLATAVTDLTQVCSLVKDVGGEAPPVASPGHVPVWVETVEDRPAGTTWVFADGSQVLASDAKERELEDVLSELDEFGKETGGENYKKEGDEHQPQVRQVMNRGKKDEDDLDDFLDEFEKTTAGENFQRQT